jgi:NAD(P)-dependent dehydrogenase (short-subunit alcohol dehydrogenase family)
MGRLDGMVAIVTGGGQGVGFGIAHAFADEGAKLVLTGRVKDKLEGKADILRQQGCDVVTVEGNVRERNAAKEAAAAALDAFGRIDIVVNNAQSMPTHVPLDQQTDEMLESVIESGLYGTIYFMQEAFEGLSKQGGSIINMGSLMGTQGSENSAAYAAAKEGIRGVSRVAARDWGKYGIKVNTICPGAKSENFMQFFEANPEELPKYENALALRRFAECYEDVGALAVYLASPECFITGQTLHCDGGQFMP